MLEVSKTNAPDCTGCHYIMAASVEPCNDCKRSHPDHIYDYYASEEKYRKIMKEKAWDSHGCGDQCKYFVDDDDFDFESPCRTCIGTGIGDEKWERPDNYEPVNPTHDVVNHPSHYAKGGIECIEAIKASMSREAFAGYCKGNCLKYIWRYEDKNGKEDLEKAAVYLKWLKENA